MDGSGVMECKGDKIVKKLVSGFNARENEMYSGNESKRWKNMHVWEFGWRKSLNNKL